MRIAFAALLLLLGVQAAHAQEKKGIEVEQTQEFLKAYDELSKKYPKASPFFAVVDAKTRSQLPQCSGSQMSCCIEADQHPPRCLSWSCCPLLK